MAGKVARSRAVPYFLRRHNRTRPETAHQDAHNRRPGWRHQFLLNFAGIYRYALQQFQCGRCRHGHNSVRALHAPATYVQRRRENLLNLQGFGAHCRTNDVGDRVGRADLVKVHVGYVYVMDFRLGRTQSHENLARRPLGAVADRSRLYDSQDLSEVPALDMMVTLTFSVVVPRGVSFAMGVLSGAAPPFGPELLAWQIFLPIDQHINLCGGNPRAVNPRPLQRNPQIERCHRSLEQFKRNSGVHQRAEEHIAADTGKSVQIRYSHGNRPPVSRTSAVVLARWELSS